MIAADEDLFLHVFGQCSTQVQLGLLEHARLAHDAAKLPLAVQQARRGLGAETLSLYTHGLACRFSDFRQSIMSGSPATA